MIGKTTLSELAILPFTESRGLGPDPQPVGHRAARSAAPAAAARAAVAAGLVGAASATDGGGSIRIPAAFCGLVGLKPQRGRVPMEPHDHWNNLSAAGCVTRTVADTALYLDVVTAGGGDPGGPEPPEQPFAVAAALARPAGCGSRSPSGRRGRSCRRSVSDEVKAGLAETEELLRSLGHDVRRHEPVVRPGRQQLRRPLPRRRSTTTSTAVPHPRAARGRGRAGSAGSAGPTRAAWLAAPRARRPPTPRRSTAAGSEFDVLVTPTVGETAIEVGRWAGKGALRTLLGMSRTFCFTPIWNHTGQPAMAMPGRLHGERECRARSPSSAARAASRPCSRSRPRSRPSVRGRIAARRVS